MRTLSKPSHHRPSSAKTTEGKSSPLTTSSSIQGATDWSAVLAAHEQRHAQALAALEQKYSDRLNQLEERLAATERNTADLDGQIKEMR